LEVKTKHAEIVRTIAEAPIALFSLVVIAGFERILGPSFKRHQRGIKEG
jgi:hypothetical protein